MASRRHSTDTRYSHAALFLAVFALVAGIGTVAQSAYLGVKAVKSVDDRAPLVVILKDNALR